jgi:hypothetical protein
MGERDWRMRYKDARKQADQAANDLLRGYEIKGWHYEPAWMPGMDKEPPKLHLEGAAWVVYLYEIALENARTLVHVHGKQYQYAVDDCERLIAKYKQFPNNQVEEQPAYNVYEAGWGELPED